MSKFIKGSLNVFFIVLLSALAFSCLFSCQKASPNPYSNPGIGTPNTISPPTFSAEVNNSLSVTSFTPGKSVVGSNTNLKGTSSYYTIILTFPSSTGTGNYTIGTHFGAGFTAVLLNGSTTYVVNTFGIVEQRIEMRSNQGICFPFGIFSHYEKKTSRGFR